MKEAEWLIEVISHTIKCKCKTPDLLVAKKVGYKLKGEMVFTTYFPCIQEF